VDVSSGNPAVFVRGIGAVSPAGWGIAPLREALAAGNPTEARPLARPGWTEPLRARPVPPPATRPSFLAHPRLRRTSPVTHYAVAAALEAIAGDRESLQHGLRLGIVFCAMQGCVNYSRRFFSEVLKDPATASPLVFPETVFNAPSSHLSSLLGTGEINYTLVGDPGVFIHGLAVAADWLIDNRVDGCLVVGSEELDWLTCDAMRLFSRRTIVSEGAGALYLSRSAGPGTRVRLHAVTGAHPFAGRFSRGEAAMAARAELAPFNGAQVLCDGRQGLAVADRDEEKAWNGWPGERLSPKRVLGEGLMAAAAWQCAAAVDALLEKRYPAATVSVVGCNQQAVAAQFIGENQP
jgi:hypothetical protein